MNKKEIGKRLRTLRSQRSRREVAKAVSVSVSALTMYEIGERMPRDEIKESLSEYYGVTVGSIFFNEK